MIKIESKIIKAEVVKDDAPAMAAPIPYDRPASLHGVTYKIKPGSMNSALYVTINSITLPDGTRRPLEVFLNARDGAHAQWMMALTRLLSALLRQPLPYDFAIEELKQISDPHGPYFLGKDDPTGRGRCPSVVAHVARVLELYCREELGRSAPVGDANDSSPAPKETTHKALYCRKCGSDQVRMLDGCWTCTACGDSKCG